MAKSPPPKKYGTSGSAGTPRASKSTAGKATPMPKKRTPYTTPRSGGNQLGSYGHSHNKGAPTAAKQVHR